MEKQWANSGDGTGHNAFASGVSAPGQGSIQASGLWQGPWVSPHPLALYPTPKYPGPEWTGTPRSESLLGSPASLFEIHSLNNLTGSSQF